MIEFRHVSKSFEDKPVLVDIDLVLKDHEITYIIGTSGTGKSVLMKHAVGLLRPDSGRILIDSKDMTDASEEEWYQVRRRYLMVFQHPALFDSMPVIGNVALPLMKHYKLDRRKAYAEAMNYLQMVGLDEKAWKLPSEVAITERKKVSIARALAVQPQCIILDEPTTGLDVYSSASIDKLIMNLAHELKKTVVVISHDLRSILNVAQRVVLLYKGKVHLDGEPKDFLATKDPIARQFMRGEAHGPMET
jgi:phospholipid/cholesterol/gamma-HCH transport system ATP-binding protein